MTTNPAAIAHDYLAQYGGAERVVAEWSRLLPEVPIYTLAYEAEATYPEFRDAEVSTPRFGRSTVFTSRIPTFLPVLPLMAARLRVDSEGWVLVSSSGFAHGFPTTARKIVYCHSPARWIYEVADYRRGLGRSKRAALRVISPYLRRVDLRAAKTATAYIANSKVTQARIARAYGVHAPVVNPPVGARAAGVAPDAVLPDEFALCVARARGYKNVALAVESAERAGVPLVVVGSGSEILTGGTVHGLGRVSDAELSWLYARARVLVAVAQEDFGLTPVEAAWAGTPTVAIDSGGYRESVSHEHSGLLVADDPDALASGIREACRESWNAAEIRAHAERFSPRSHLLQIADIAEATR
nr:glycosyltransferase [Microbacterium testaceum]